MIKNCVLLQGHGQAFHLAYDLITNALCVHTGKVLETPRH